MNLKLADSITINWYRFTLLCTLNCNWVHVSLYLNVLAWRKIWGRLGFVPTIFYRKASSLWKCPSFCYNIVWTELNSPNQLYNRSIGPELSVLLFLKIPISLCFVPHLNPAMFSSEPLPLYYERLILYLIKLRWK